METIVLKGPGFARLLYDRGEIRGYGDVDVLVQASDVPAAEAALIGLGFSPPERGAYANEVVHATTFKRVRDAMSVDLHHTLVGFEHASDPVWRAFSEGAEPLELFGQRVLVPRPAVQAFHVAAHAVQHGPQNPKPLEDLRRALTRVDDATWREAAAAAATFGGTDALAAGLRLDSAGVALAERIGLGDPESLDVRLRAAGAPATALGWARLLRAPGLPAKLRLARAELVPTPAYMRVWSPAARRSRVMLGVMYLWRPLWLLRRAGPALAALRTARRSA